MTTGNSFDILDTLSFRDQTYDFWSLPALAEKLSIDLAAMPFSIRILLENLLRNEDGSQVTESHIRSLAQWSARNIPKDDIPYKPARVLMQDFTGVPSVVDLAAMRDAISGLGGRPGQINPQIPVELVIDHSVQVDRFGASSAFGVNAEKEFERNQERYTFLKWGQNSFENFNVVPPATGICHQVNLEYLGRVVMSRQTADRSIIYPDTLVGLDSHTTMINAIGVLGWGVGGIEAEAVMLGQPYYMLAPPVLGFELTGRLRPGVTATDLVLTITQMLRKKGVVGQFIEFFGQGLSRLTVPDRATIANMTPEFGATTTFFPVDEQTLKYLAFTGRSRDQVDLARQYLRAQGLFLEDQSPTPGFSDIMQLDLDTVEPCLAGPRRPQDRIALSEMKQQFQHDFDEIFSKNTRAEKDPRWEAEGGAVAGEEQFQGRMVHRKPLDSQGVFVKRPFQSFFLDHGSVVIAAITSCTNTSNPEVLLGAGLMAKKAVEQGLQVRPWVKTSLAPGSRVVTDYLEVSGLMPYLEALRFHVAAYGCTTCIGNSGPLQEDVAGVIRDQSLVASSVLSGNRNYEGRINPLTRANYLASPMLVVAYALAGTVNIDLQNDPIGHDGNNEPVYLKDIWPDDAEIDSVMQHLAPSMFSQRYADVYSGDENWKKVEITDSEIYAWDSDSTYLRKPPFFDNMTPEPPDMTDIESARVLAVLGDTITTDHISPAGAIAEDSPAGKYLKENGVEKKDFNSYGSRRGNHEVMMRGTFANARLQNRLVPDTEGGWTRHLPTGETLSIYDAAMKYQQENTPLIILAGKEYGSGSSRDWAAKGTLLLGVRAVIAQSFERIHRSNLVAMGVLPLQFIENQNAETLELTGEEVLCLRGLKDISAPNPVLTVEAESDGSRVKNFEVRARLDSSMEIEYFRHGGILPYVLRQM
ncbi:MAG: aconitate hydratase AcnA [Desulfosalsimonas sp.]|uniref:aconitate hydratase AcnA n=1 Tax=Desulfosalsimonas sp. TaxID=3073848 RepID=UPI003970E26E